MESREELSPPQSESTTLPEPNEEEDEDFPGNPSYIHYFQAYGVPMEKNQHELNKTNALKVLMSPTQLEQFECYSESRFDFHVVRAIMHKVSQAPVDDVSVFLMCELAKGFVEDVMNAALDHKEEQNLTGPVTTDQILLALDKSENSFYLARDESSSDEESPQTSPKNQESMEHSTEEQECPDSSEEQECPEADVEFEEQECTEVPFEEQDLLQTPVEKQELTDDEGEATTESESENDTPKEFYAGPYLAEDGTEIILD